MVEKDPIIQGFDRVRIFIFGAFFSCLGTDIFFPNLNNTFYEWVIITYVGFVCMATFWDNV